MAYASPAQGESPSQVVSKLVEISELDTLYRDLYLESARNLMTPIMSNDAYYHIKDSVASLDLIERQLRAAVQRADWARTTELTERIKSIKKLADRGDTIDLAESVYDKLANIPIDPFAPGYYVFFGRSAETLNSMRKRAIELLDSLAASDPAKKDFYERRRADFEELTIAAQGEKKKEAEEVSELDLRSEALNAVDAGDLSQLTEVLERLQQQAESKKKEEETAAVKLGAEAQLGDDLLYSFSEASLAAAARLGLAPVKTKSRRHLAYLVPYEWHPSFLKTESKRWAKDQLSHLTHPFESSDKVREAVELYLFNPFINSGGTRYRVCLVVEDLLTEDFDEPEPKTEMPKTELLNALGLKTRWGLTRIELENALIENGPGIVRDELQLDPELFKLVAIPPDVYTILGPDRGWGTKEMWTHYDGYWVREGGALQALAGGDTRFGGTHDVVCFSQNYTSDKILARFAVVQRKRMMSWHKK